jgi:hypothetical protein
MKTRIDASNDVPILFVDHNMHIMAFQGTSHRDFVRPRLARGATGLATIRASSTNSDFPK